MFLLENCVKTSRTIYLYMQNKPCTQMCKKKKPKKNKNIWTVLGRLNTNVRVISHHATVTHK